jgi:hypothetical protein
VALIVPAALTRKAASCSRFWSDCMFSIYLVIACLPPMPDSPPTLDRPCDFAPAA